MADSTTHIRIPTGIAPLDERVGGLEAGGMYLVTGAPGPAKMVAIFHFLAAGLEAGERVLLLTSGDARSILQVAEAWGFPFRPAWERGDLQLLGFRDDFELRALRTVEPREVLEELAQLVEPGFSRVAVDPGSMFLSGETRTLLGTAFLNWGRRSPATVCASYSTEAGGGGHGTTPDWLIPAITGVILVESRPGGLHQISLASSVPEAGETGDDVTLQLKPGAGLVVPDSMPARRHADREGLDPDRLLLISLGGAHAADLESWAVSAFETTVVTEPFEAVSHLQGDAHYGSVLVHAPRNRVREATQACRAIRPLTRGAVVFASDDGVRSTDRIRILEAGADDCISGGIDFRELAVRLRQALNNGIRHPAVQEQAPVEERDEGMPAGGVLDSETLATEIRARMEDPGRSVFALVEVRGPVGAHVLEGHLADEIREEDGDVLVREGDRVLVLLQGAREGQAAAILRRLKARLDQGDSDRALEVQVAAHPSDPRGVERLLEARGAFAD